MECGGCTECCESFYIDSKKALVENEIELITIDSPAGELCQHCDKNVGCTIHEDRPKICRDFMCAYAQQENAPIELRPDKCGIIFEKMDDTLFIGTIKPNNPVSEYAFGQITAFNDQGYDVVLTKHDTIEPKVFVRKGIDKFDVIKKFLHYRRVADGKYTNN